MERISRTNLVNNARNKFYENATQLYKENADAPVLGAPPPAKKQAPMAPAPVKSSSSMQRPSSKGPPATATTTKARQPSANRASKTDLTAKPTQVRQNSANKSASALSSSIPSSVPQKKSLNKDLKLEPQMKPLVKKPEPFLSQTVPPKAPKVNLAQAKFEHEIEMKIERNLLFIKKLQSTQNPPPYASSLLQSARHNKTNVLQAHLSVLSGSDRIAKVNSVDKNLRSPAMFAAFYNNADAIELLSASDANLQLVDRYQRSVMHYAVIQDNTKLIQTIFLSCKGNSKPVSQAPASSIEKPSVEESKWSGQTDERYEDMEQQMGLLDTIFTKEVAEEKTPCEKQYCKPTSVINRRDAKGRTPLFAAVAFNNKQAVETLLHLGANPHIEDCYGQRPTDICYVEAIKGLLEIKMQTTAKPSGENQSMSFASSKSQATVPTNLKGTQSSKFSGGSEVPFKTKEEKTYPLEIRDIKRVPKEKVIEARIGAESDTYLHHAIKQKRLDLLQFLLSKVPELALDAKNSQGQTPFHLAVKSANIQILKAICIQNHKVDDSNIDELLQTNTNDNIRGNINPKIVQLFSMQNNKGMTPLIVAVDERDKDMFKFLLDLMAFLQTTQPNTKALSTSIDFSDIKQETALLKAVRTSQTEIVFKFLSLLKPETPLSSDDEPAVRPAVLPYESLLPLDITSKNVLHHAVITKQKDLIAKLIHLDADHSLLRKQKDAKNKLPQAYDDSQLFTSSFITQWDCASTGSLQKLKQVYGGQRTHWYGNSCLYLGVKGQQLEVVKYLMAIKDTDADSPNFKGVSATQICTGLKDLELKRTMQGLLDRTKSSTKVVRGTEIKEEKKQRLQMKDQEVVRLVNELKKALDKAGITDLVGVFKRFDTNKDGYFNEVEFSCAFTVLKVEFSKDSLHKLIRLTDTDNDGRISYPEFERMINSATNTQGQKSSGDMINEEVLSSDDEREQQEPSTGAAKKYGGNLAAVQEFNLEEDNE